MNELKKTGLIVLPKLFKHPVLIVAVIGIVTVFFALQIPWASLDNNNLRFVLEGKTAEKWDGRYHTISAWRRLNGVPLRDTKDALMANYVCFEMKRRETGEAVYKNGWITDKPATEENVERLASCGRTRWKIENEHNNALKNRDTISNTISGTEEPRV